MIMLLSKMAHQSKPKNPTLLLSLSFIFTVALFSSASSLSENCCKTDVKRSEFPDQFLFGTATASHQVEGGYLEDGKGLSNWDVFSHVSGNIVNNDDADVADDHYHRILEDIEIMHSLGVNSYRFSISWSRILPKGRFGEVNKQGIEFYNKLIDHLLARDIEPFVTIFHHEHPQELQDRYASWLSPLMQDDFVHLAETCFKYFGDRVKYWTTLNEPNILTDFTYIRGIYPPQHCSPPFGNCSAGNSDTEALFVLHNMILAHAKAVQLYRKHFQQEQGGSIGIVAHSMMYEPFSDHEKDREAAKRALAFNLGWLLDPLMFGEYPAEMRKYHGSKLPRFSDKEREYVKGSIDFIGINHYSTLYAKDCISSSSSCPDSNANHPIRGFILSTGERNGVEIGEHTAAYSFYVVPRGMEEIVMHISTRYNNIPIYVTENGYASQSHDKEKLETVLNDVKRVEFHKAYLANLAKAIKQGANVRGYFIWSLIDNFEWVLGYTIRFGIYYVDRVTLERLPKLSAKWYKNFLNNNDNEVECCADLSEAQILATGVEEHRGSYTA